MRIITLILLLSVFCIHGNSQFDSLIQKYNTLITIAGKGNIDSKGINGWKTEYEGGNAVDAELSRPHFAMADSNGNIYIADKDAHAVRKIVNEKIYTVADTNIAGDDDYHFRR